MPKQEIGGTRPHAETGEDRRLRLAPRAAIWRMQIHQVDDTPRAEVLHNGAMNILLGSLVSV